MDAEKFEKTFWNYYLELEREYLKIERLIPFDETNYNTFSYKYIELLGTICSDIDVLFKEYMNIKEYTPELDEDNNPIYNIYQYTKFVENQIPNFKNQEIICYNPKFHNKELHPYISLRMGDSPLWWGVNNKIKHHYDTDFRGKKAYKHANQICVLNALAALFQLNLYIYKELKMDSEDELKVPLYESKLFQLENWGDYYRYIINGRDTSKIIDDLTKELINFGETD